MPIDANGNWVPEYEDWTNPFLNGQYTASENPTAPANPTVGYHDPVYSPDGGQGTATPGSSSGGFWDSLGNWVSNNSGTIGGLIGAGLSTAIAPSLANWQSGGLLNKSTDMIGNAIGALQGVKAPDLNALIPQLQLQVQQGLMSPANAVASLAQVQGNFTPTMMQAALATVQGQMTPEQYNVVTAVVQGHMDPVTAQEKLQDASLMGGVNSDPATIAGARKALAQLDDIAQNKGVTEADRAQYNAIMNQANANAAQQRQAQIQQLQMQGNAGQGAELAARLSGVQGTANSNAAAGAQLAQSAQARALQAIQAGLAGNTQLNSQMFNQDASKAQAQDAVNQFNAAAKNTFALQNAANQQQANALNYNTQNQFALQNAAAQNAGAQFNAGQRQAANTANFNMNNQFALQNAAAQNQANATNTQAANQAGLANYNMQNQFALANQQAQNQANMANAGYQNQANMANFQMANQIGANNTNIKNQQALLPYQAAQQNFTNQADLAKSLANANLSGSGLLQKYAQTQTDYTKNLINSPTIGGSSGNSNVNPGTTPGGAAGNAAGGAIGSAIGKGVGGYIADNAGDWWDTISNWFSDEDLKTNKKPLSDDDVDQMMGHLTGYKYRYKGQSNPEQRGVMAQDLEKGGSESVIDTPAGKMVQGPKALSEALAVLANQNERIRKLEGK